MSSVHSYIRQTNTLFTNSKDMVSSIYQSDCSTLTTWVSTAASTVHSSIRVVGTGVFRDMGKLVYKPTPDAGSGAVSSIFRKVQLVPRGTGQTGQGVGTAADGLYYVGYVSVGAVDGVSGGLVRIN
jgi:hypothetical protein